MKRLLTIVLSFIIMTAMGSFVGFAATGGSASNPVKVSSATALNNAIKNASGETYIQLTGKISVNTSSFPDMKIIVPEGKKINLDLNGYAVNGPAKDAAMEAMYVEGRLVVSDSKGGGSIRGLFTGGKSEFILLGGTIKGLSYSCALGIHGNAEIRGGAVTAVEASAIDIATEGYFKMTGGKVSSTSQYEGAIYASQGTITISGGSITGKCRGIWLSGEQAKLTMTGGKASSVFFDYGSSGTLVVGSTGVVPEGSAEEGYHLNYSGGIYTVAPHDWVKKTSLAATTYVNGSVSYECANCHKAKTETVYSPKKMKLSYTAGVYSGKYKKPTVKVVDTKGRTISSANYSVAYSSNKSVGKGTVKVTFKGNYSGTMSATFKIKPKGTTLSSLKKSQKALKVQWKKQSTKMAESRITGYQLRYSTSSSMKNAKTKRVKGYSNTSKKLTGLKSKTRYYVQIRTYKTVDGVTYYSSWSSKKNLQTK